MDSELIYRKYPLEFINNSAGYIAAFKDRLEDLLEHVRYGIVSFSRFPDSSSYMNCIFAQCEKGEDIEKELRKDLAPVFARIYGLQAVRFEPTYGLGTGTSDYILNYMGNFIGLETKAPYKPLEARETQVKFAARTLLNQGSYIILNGCSDRLEEILDAQ